MFKIILTKINTLQFFLKKRYIVAQYKLYVGDEWLSASIDSVIQHVDKVLLVISDTSWGDTQIEQDNILIEIEQIRLKYPSKIEIHTGSWNNQKNQVQAGLDYIRKEISNATHCLYIDSDEIYDQSQIKKLIQMTKRFKYFNKELRVSMKTYFKSINYLIFPDVPFKPMALFPIRNYIKYNTVRNGMTSFENVDVFFHHLSFVRNSDEKIKNKFVTHQHDEKLCNTSEWYSTYWENFNINITNFHPSDNPEEFAGIKVIDDSEIPFVIRDKYKSF